MSDQRQWSWSDSLEEAIRAEGSAVELMRDLGVGRFTEVPDEFTHWIEEQRAWRETVAFADQSYHMTDLRVEGPDALGLYSDLGVNDFDGFEVGDAKQLVVANPNGYFIGDAILFHEDDDEFLSVGAASAHNWLQYHAETGDYDVEARFQGRPVATGEDPTNFRFQVQGPNAIEVMETVVDDPLPEIGFFDFAETSIDGRDVRLLRHGMAGEPGFEFWGPYEYGDEVKGTVMDAGEEYGIRHLGADSYQTPNVVLGWIPLVVPAIFDDELTDYREWLDVGRGLLSIGGSFDSGDITDYYFTPVELGYGRLVDLDGDFVGREALEAEVENPDRERVTLVWDDEDVIDVHASMFREGETYKYLELPHSRWAACPYDEVRKDGDLVGMSTDKAYIYNHREMLSLGVVDTEYADPGTEVSIVWGEPDGGEANPRVERHVQTEIAATVAPSPYKEDNR